MEDLDFQTFPKLFADLFLLCSAPQVWCLQFVKKSCIDIKLEISTFL